MGDSNPYLKKISWGEVAIWPGRHPLLKRLDIELTERCNNNCLHCYINLPADDLGAKKRELSTSAWKAILEEAAGLGCLTVRFTGGEPLLREDFEELYQFTRRLGLQVLLFTNATRVTPRLTKMLSAIPPLEPIEVTLYGTKPESYDQATRMPGSFQEAQKGIRLLAKEKIPFVIKSVWLPSHQEELSQLREWGLGQVKGMTSQPKWTMVFDLRARRDSMVKNQLIRELRPTAAECLKVFVRGDYYEKEMCRLGRHFLSPQGTGLFACGAGLGQGCVDAYGFFQPCMLLRHPEAVVDLRQHSLETALRSFFPKLRDRKSDNPLYLDRCGRCFLKGLCEQCPAKSWMEHGTLDTPVDYLCELAHVQARFLGWLKPGEVGWQVGDGPERINRMRQQIKAPE